MWPSNFCTRTVKKLAHTIWACDGSEVNDGPEVPGGSRVVIQRVGDAVLSKNSLTRFGHVTRTNLLMGLKVSFTSNNATDTLYVFDSNSTNDAAGGTDVLHAIVLVGYVLGGTAGTNTTTGLIGAALPA